MLLFNQIQFTYDKHEKPYLQPSSSLQFNLSHSDDFAVYALTLNYPVGIDVEKIQTHFNENIAKRFFSAQEYTALMSRPEEERIIHFYRIWARKEAIIKANGKGLAIPLNSFSVSDQNIREKVMLDQKETWALLPLDLHNEYQSAVATHLSINKVSHWKLLNQLPQLDKEYSL